MFSIDYRGIIISLAIYTLQVILQVVQYITLPCTFILNTNRIVYIVKEILIFTLYSIIKLVPISILGLKPSIISIQIQKYLSIGILFIFPRIYRSNSTYLLILVLDLILFTNLGSMLIYCRFFAYLDIQSLSTRFIELLVLRQISIGLLLKFALIYIFKYNVFNSYPYNRRTRGLALITQPSSNIIFILVLLSSSIVLYTIGIISLYQVIYFFYIRARFLL